MTSPSPAPLLARAVAVNAAEPLGQARQVTLVDPLALIRPVEPDGRPAHYPRLPLQPALFEGRHITVVTETKGGHTPGTTIAEGCRLTKSESNAVVMGGVGREGFAGC